MRTNIVIDIFYTIVAWLLNSNGNTLSIRKLEIKRVYVLCNVYSVCFVSKMGIWLYGICYTNTYPIGSFSGNLSCHWRDSIEVMSGSK